MHAYTHIHMHTITHLHMHTMAHIQTHLLVCTFILMHTGAIKFALLIIAPFKITAHSRSQLL